MINCPSCKMSNLGGAACAYCKAPLPTEEAEAPVFASVTEYASLATESTVPAAEPEPVRVATQEKPKKQASSGDRSLDELREFERRSAERKTGELKAEPHPTPPPRVEPRRALKGPFQKEAVMSAVLPGLGQVVKGMPERGYLMLAGVAILSLFQWTWLVMALWGFNIYDANQADEDSVGEQMRKFIRDLFGQA